MNPETFERLLMALKIVHWTLQGVHLVQKLVIARYDRKLSKLRKQ
jgi:hypothetical protein